MQFFLCVCLFCVCVSLLTRLVRVAAPFLHARTYFCAGSSGHAGSGSLAPDSIPRTTASRGPVGRPPWVESPRKTSPGL
uniref:Putative secreted protein n=1 Tax=Ixodes ricinus TaxID=34613 RepID=A0A6B0U772_IXORI